MEVDWRQAGLIQVFKQSARHSSVSVSTSASLSSSFVLKQVLLSTVKGGPPLPPPRLETKSGEEKPCVLIVFTKGQRFYLLSHMWVA